MKILPKFRVHVHQQGDWWMWEVRQQRQHQAPTTTTGKARNRGDALRDAINTESTSENH